jgi:CRISPR-associated protein Cas5h
MTQTVAFEVWGDYGHFRKPYAPLSPVTYPVPPPTAVLGLLGAICGIDKDRYHDELGWETVQVGMRSLNPLRLYRAGLNLLNTKDGTDRYFRPSKGASHIQVPYEFLVEPRFRIFVGALPASWHETLVSRLEQRQPEFTPTLGLANCLAEVKLVAAGEAETLGTGATEVSSVVPLGDSIKLNYTGVRAVQRFRIPAQMDGDRVVHRYQEVAVATDGEPLSVEGVAVHRLGDDVFCFI